MEWMLSRCCKESTLFSFLKKSGREGLMVYVVALAISFLGRTELAVRSAHGPWPVRALSLPFSGWGGCSLEETKAGGLPRGAAC